MLPAAPKLLTVAETATLLRVSKPTVYRWAASGYLPSIQYGQPRVEGESRRGGAIRIPSSAVQELLDLATEEVA
ncbi:helix-turn-helix domain-containing protein [Streptomyces sp. KN37]|uniref:helix-turn-helix domain-containing protein n=1 Tax=Streptomyces sp. KN37 TaxID=3090667 RepID=UPI002A756285|nr:helix-turn-helix domain-containing protein [Streptomyces sp. KN37]WPO74004.1 helix-turn-helix domain-containing protein [Streptomyces sp. KN37]